MSALIAPSEVAPGGPQIICQEGQGRDIYLRLLFVFCPSVYFLPKLFTKQLFFLLSSFTKAPDAKNILLSGCFLSKQSS